MNIADENWQVLVSAFPSGWKELGRASKAIKQKLKEFDSEDQLLRVLLLHIGRGLSLRETAVLAKLGGLADVTDVAILKRLRASEQWLLELCRLLLRESGVQMPAMQLGLALRLVDSSIICEPGKTGSQWRLHYSIRLPDICCDAFKITPSQGKYTGDSFTQYSIAPGDYIIGDRAYAKSRSVEYVDQQNAYVLVRLNSSNMPLFNEDGSSFNTLDKISSLVEPLAVKSWPVYVQKENGGFIAGRLCGLRKSEMKIVEAQQKLMATANKKQRKVQPETLEFAKYILVFSTFSEWEFTPQALLEYYRLRWQIELIFKRLKTILAIGHLPKYDPASARAWLYGKLFLALLTEKLARLSRAFSPWGYPLPQPLARI